jgi:hypothetical protein
VRNRFTAPIAGLVFLLVFSFHLLGHSAPGSRAKPPGTINGRSGERVQTKAQTPTSQPFDPHDLSGVWVLQRQKIFTLSTDKPPMTAWGQAKFNETKPGYGPRAIPPAFGNDPIGNCDPSGYPRIMFDPVRPMEIIQLPNRLLQHFQYHEVWRTIWTDGRAAPKDLVLPLWNGYSIGRWEGSTFVVESTDFDDRSWLDHFGDPHSDEMHLQERFRRADHDTLELTMTLTDPKTYTGPWVSELKTWKLAPKLELEQEICVPSEEQSFNRRQRDVAGGKTSP